MKSLKVLISGAGCAGPALAFWLARAGHRVTIIERNTSLRTLGAQIDIRNQGVEIIKRMGLLEKIREILVYEKGAQFIDSAGEVKVTLGTGHQAATAEYEIMRGDLVNLLYDETKDHDNVKYVFGETVERFDEKDDQVDVQFSDGSNDSFDLLVGADGQGSHIRSAILPPGSKEYRKLGVYIAYWFVPHIDTDTNYFVIYSCPGRRSILRRWHESTDTQVYCIFKDNSTPAKFDELMKAPVETQKKFWMEKFHDAGWEASRFLAGLDDTTNFYCQEIVQVATDTWSRGRVVLLGDAAHCPSPMSGLGTTSSLIGAYILAGELTQNSDDLPLALKRYDEKLRPLVNKVQTIGSFNLKLMFPQSQWAINVRMAALRFLFWLGIPRFLERFARDTSTWQMPHYPELD
ncbi:FAD/NAD(P)-binding domain-containing protein [Penicillium malachiteum]|nr:FAD/NAD(P)-binding domain-containing protein [Penicillium malachiteum]